MHHYSLKCNSKNNILEFFLFTWQLHRGVSLCRHLNNFKKTSNIEIDRFASAVTLKQLIKLIRSHHNVFIQPGNHQHNVSKLTAVTVGSVMHSIHCYTDRFPLLPVTFFLFDICNLPTETVSINQKTTLPFTISSTLACNLSLLSIAQLLDSLVVFNKSWRWE